MKHNFRSLRISASVLALVGTLAGPFASASAAPPEGLPLTGDAATHAKQLQVYDAVHQYQNALNQGDTQAIVKLFAKNGVAEWDNTLTASTPEQIAKIYDGLFKQIKNSADYVYDVIQVSSSGDMAYVRTHHPLGQTATIRETGKKVKVSSRETFVLRKVDGTWKLALFMFNNDIEQGQP
ncbi:SgcJ/EcaC family oxidoreductase [Serratia sp. DD3]|uniref:YybH family protein n=1 Tax=Serratia sp. DD3 TaxID=1410619 RepID=UPI0003C51316|nr:nuclear transport factor 2 family protein [Serratia sp. DD3]KEY60630.1 snoaL-like domain protein [Serratia sp. DD3]